MASAHYESLAEAGRQNYFPESKMNYAKYGQATESGALQYLLHLDKYYKHLKNGLDLTNHEHYDLGELGQWVRCGFIHYTIQAARGLAEGPSGYHYQHRFCVRCTYDLCMHTRLSQCCVDKDVDCPDDFVQVRVYDTSYYVVVSLPYHPKEGEGNLTLKKKLYNNLHLYF